jgi:class 3 adenylate cyclase
MPAGRAESLTLLLTDVEGSTLLLRKVGDRYGELLETHRRLLALAFAAAGGRLAQAVGDECLGVFVAPEDALAGAAAGQRAHAKHEWPADGEVRVRMGIHTGTPTPAASGDEFFGLDVHRTARICAAAHGGQVLLSNTTRTLLGNRLPEGSEIRELGSHVLKDLPEPERLFQLLIAGARNEFPPLRVGSAADGSRPSKLTPRSAQLAGVLRAAVGQIRRRAGLDRFLDRLRDLIERAPPARRQSLVALEADCLAARATFTTVEEYLAVVDREGLVQQLEEPAPGTPQAVARRERATAELEALDRLAERWSAAQTQLDEIAAELGRGAEIEPRRKRLADLARELEQAYEGAPHGAVHRLRRTRRRGVFRQGLLYVVPYVDELGVQRRRPFDEAADARAFARAVRSRRMIEQTPYTGVTEWDRWAHSGDL